MRRTPKDLSFRALDLGRSSAASRKTGRSGSLASPSAQSPLQSDMNIVYLLHKYTLLHVNAYQYTIVNMLICTTVIVYLFFHRFNSSS